MDKLFHHTLYKECHNLSILGLKLIRVSKRDPRTTRLWDMHSCIAIVVLGLLYRFRRTTSQWRHNEPDGVLNHQPHDCLPNDLFRRISNKTSKLRLTGLCTGNSPVTGEFPAQKASNAENVSIPWRYHDLILNHTLDFKIKCGFGCDTKSLYDCYLIIYI